MEAVPIQSENFKLGFIGAGKMAESIARGVVQSGVLPPQRISTAIHSNPSRGTAFQSLGISVYSHNTDVRLYKGPSASSAPGALDNIDIYIQGVVDASDVIIFSVKPQVVKNVILQLRPLLSKKKLLVSIAAGVKLKDLEEWAGHDRFIRVMPNTPSAVGMGASVMSLGGAATEQDGELVGKLFGAVGKTWKADEKLFDAVTGLSKVYLCRSVWSEILLESICEIKGSGPAYIYLAIEALADGGVAAGLPRELALGLASQTCSLIFLERSLTSPQLLAQFYLEFPCKAKVYSGLFISGYVPPVGPLLLVQSIKPVLGAAAMAVQSGKHPGQLKDDVTSPGGTTIAGIHELEKNGFRGTLMNAVVAAAKRSQELSKN
ncbi:hypothetical protein GOBAR_AA12058 [Gossypium barbadense]|uniref:Pyrroline-5-carboxylate reductase n=1 Tax=Gossypium barbadense TaxID=3634 RepID=A0A2P5XZ12_GOSBA|nr:hypothetical protein GOBAR_AA12058 [Gossypium barbadense]